MSRSTGSLSQLCKVFFNHSPTSIIMFEIVKKGVYMGLGLASLTKDKVQQFASDVAREAKLSEEQGRKFEEELQQRVEASKSDLEAEIDKRIDQTLVQVGIVKAGFKKTAGEAADGIQGIVDRRIDEALVRFRIARQEDVDSLKQRIELLESKLHAAPGETPIVHTGFES